MTSKNVEKCIVIHTDYLFMFLEGFPNFIRISSLFLDGKMAIFTTCGGNRNCCESSNFPVSKQTMKVKFSLDVLGKLISRFSSAETKATLL